MKRVIRVLKNYFGVVTDWVVLDYDHRHRRRIALTSEKGISFLLDLAAVPDLREQDAFEIEGGAIIVVKAAPEDLMEITCTDALHLARVAWHLGNRHLPTELVPGVIRIRADHVIGEMAEGLGARVKTIQAPFNPERGAYDQKAATQRHHHGGHHHHHHDDSDHHHD